MTIVKSTENNYCIIFNPTELRTLETLIPIYQEYMVKDIPTLLKFLLQTEFNTYDRGPGL